jgi:phage shock protein E
MNWIVIAIPVVVVLAYSMMKRAGGISPEKARDYLRSGALVIDVRSPGEFNAGHLPNAVNLPVDEMDTTLPGRLKDKDRVLLLLYCQSGMRSGMARSRLAGLGYAHAFNLGSYARAARIVSTG